MKEAAGFPTSLNEPGAREKVMINSLWEVALFAYGERQLFAFELERVEMNVPGLQLMESRLQWKRSSTSALPNPAS